MSNLTSPQQSLITYLVTEALRSSWFDPEETVFDIVTAVLGEEPGFDLYEQVSMELGIA